MANQTEVGLTAEEREKYGRIAYDAYCDAAYLHDMGWRDERWPDYRGKYEAEVEAVIAAYEADHAADRARCAAVEQAAEAVVEHFGRWLAYKSDNGYWDGYETDLSWQGEKLLDALASSLAAPTHERAEEDR